MKTRTLRSLFAFILLLLLSLEAIAQTPNEAVTEVQVVEEPRVLFIGHNMTPTTEAPSGGEWTLGTYALGAELGKGWFLATSPWIWASYNSANVHLKYANQVSSRDRVGFFFSYFESFESEPLATNFAGSSPLCPPGRNCRRPPGQAAETTTVVYGLNRYQWQSASSHLLYSHEFDSGLKFYGNTKYTHYWNDDLPYSLRMDPGADSIRNQIDVTTLISDSFGKSPFHWAVEVGALGLNYIYPYFHGGLSLSYRSSSWLIQAGASYTAQFQELSQRSAWVPGRFDTRIHRSQSGQNYYFRYLQTALHPEVQLQFSF